MMVKINKFGNQFIRTLLIIFQNWVFSSFTVSNNFEKIITMSSNEALFIFFFQHKLSIFSQKL